MRKERVKCTGEGNGGMLKYLAKGKRRSSQEKGLKCPDLGMTVDCDLASYPFTNFFLKNYEGKEMWYRSDVTKSTANSCNHLTLFTPVLFH